MSDGAIFLLFVGLSYIACWVVAWKSTASPNMRLGVAIFGSFGLLGAWALLAWATIARKVMNLIRTEADADAPTLEIRFGDTTIEAGPSRALADVSNEMKRLFP